MQEFRETIFRGVTFNQCKRISGHRDTEGFQGLTFKVVMHNMGHRKGRSKKNTETIPKQTNMSSNKEQYAAGAGIDH